MPQLIVSRHRTRMELSETEKRMIEKLKKRQQFLVRWRWVGLIGTLVYVVVGLCGVVFSLHFLNRSETTPDLIVACIFAAALGLFALGVVLAAYLLLNWNGDCETRLLLRLIEDSQNDG